MKQNINTLSNLGFIQRKAIDIAQNYMQKMTKRFLDFKYTNEEITVPKPDENKSYLLYLHVPFCQTLCPYCSFHRFKFKEEQTREYFELLRTEMMFAKQQGYKFSSLYIGGGTTTIIPDELVKTIEYAKELFDIKEVTCESDPLIDEEFVELLSPHITRLSVGLQTVDDERLKKLKRYKKFGSSQEQLNNIKKAIGHFPVVNIDMIFNFPGQSMQDLQNDLEVVKTELNPDQISYYPLMYSPSVKKSMQKMMGDISNEYEVGFYNAITASLNQEYEQLSSWSFGKKGVSVLDEYVVDHNEYLGLGSGSFSFIDDTLYINTFSLSAYKKKIESGQFSIERKKQYAQDDRLRYLLMLDFFSDGFDAMKYKVHHNIDVTRKFKYEFKLMRLLGIIEKNSFKLTPYGHYFFLTLMKEFYTGMDFVRETSRKNISACGYS